MFLLVRKKDRALKSHDMRGMEIEDMSKYKALRPGEHSFEEDV